MATQVIRRQTSIGGGVVEVGGVFDVYQQFAQQVSRLIRFHRPAINVIDAEQATYRPAYISVRSPARFGIRR